MRRRGRIGQAPHPEIRKSCAFSIPDHMRSYPAGNHIAARVDRGTGAGSVGPASPGIRARNIRPHLQDRDRRSASLCIPARNSHPGLRTDCDSAEPRTAAPCIWSRNNRHRPAVAIVLARIGAAGPAPPAHWKTRLQREAAWIIWPRRRSACTCYVSLRMHPSTHVSSPAACDHDKHANSTFDPVAPTHNDYR